MSFLKSFFSQLMPYLVMGMILVACIGLLSLFASIVMWGAVLGLGFYVIAVVHRFFFNKSSEPLPRGRVIEHEE